MKIASTALVAMLVVVLVNDVSTDAFCPHRLLLPQQSRGPNGPPVTMTTTNRRAMGFPVARFAALDDDEDEDDEDDDDDEIDPLEPLANGIDSVSWLPSVKDTKTSTSSSSSSSSSSEEHPNAELIPLFPLGGIVYTPNSQHTLNIFEPRYREMYTDILMNGTKRFAVSMSHPTKSGIFAQMAVLFELEDLKEVSERTADQIKYVCQHKVTGRVQLHRVLNPQDWETRSTYLRAEGTVIDDSGKSSLPSSEIVNPSIESTSSSSSSASIVVQDIENPVEQKLLKDAFADLVQLQHELEEDVRFTRASVLTMAVQPGSQKDGLWQTIKLWSSFIDQRLMSRQNDLQQDFQEKLQNYLKKEKGLKGELPRYGDRWRLDHWFGVCFSLVSPFTMFDGLVTIFFVCPQRDWLSRFIRGIAKRGDWFTETNGRRIATFGARIDIDNAKDIGMSRPFGSIEVGTTFRASGNEATEHKKGDTDHVWGKVHAVVDQNRSQIIQDTERSSTVVVVVVRTIGRTSLWCGRRQRS